MVRGGWYLVATRIRGKDVGLWLDCHNWWILVEVLDSLVTRIKLDLFVLLLIREICLATGLINISYYRCFIFNQILFFFVFFFGVEHLFNQLVLCYWTTYSAVHIVGIVGLMIACECDILLSSSFMIIFPVQVQD